MAERGRPIISVAIPTRNYGRYLSRALDSVLRSNNPTGVPIQVVVADDASTDNTSAILADYRQRYPANLEVVPIRVPRGIGAAKNAALDRCRGRTVAILDADDEFLPDKLARCHAVLEQGAVDIVTSDFIHQWESGDRLVRSFRSWGQWRTWGNWFWPPSTWVFRNGVVRFNPHSLGAEDLEWMERRWPMLRHQHLELPLGIQHIHQSRHYGQRYDSAGPASQLMGWILKCPHPNHRLAPAGWHCRECGNQYLLPTRCCGRPAVPRPLLFYWTAHSPYHPAQTEFSLVILTHNGLRLTQRAVRSFLERLPADRRREVELIFVDSYSTDGTLDYIRSLAAEYPVKLIVTHPTEPFNYARACNRGAHAAVGRYLLLLNNDIELRSEDPWEPLRAALSDPRVGVVGSSTGWSLEHRDPNWQSVRDLYLVVNRPLRGEFWGARLEVFWELGGVDEAFSGYGYDELDFQFRAQLAHYHLAVARVLVHHEGSQTFKQRFRPAALRKLEKANHQLFERKHARRIYTKGHRVEPYASHHPPGWSLVVVARNQAAHLHQTLERAARDPLCINGAVQVIVVDNGSTDDTALLLQAYRLRLPSSLNVISLPEPLAADRAQQLGHMRAVGKTTLAVTPGDWPEAGSALDGARRSGPRAPGLAGRSSPQQASASRSACRQSGDRAPRPHRTR